MPNHPAKILFIIAEAAPMVKVGGLADVGSALPKTLKALGYDVRLMLPVYGPLNHHSWNVQPTGKSFAINLAANQRLLPSIAVQWTIYPWTTSITRQIMNSKLGTLNWEDV